MAKKFAELYWGEKEWVPCCQLNPYSYKIRWETFGNVDDVLYTQLQAKDGVDYIVAVIKSVNDDVFWV